MKSATMWDEEDRKRLGLLPLAREEDIRGSLEVSGHPTDIYRAEASRMFNTPYWLVTNEQRRAAKTALYYARYQ